MLNLLSKIRFGLLFVLPTALFCSYYPIISLGANSSMNFELSLPLIWLVIFTLLSLPEFIIHLCKSIKAKKLWPLTLLLPLYFSLSILWSPNQLRAFLTAGILWCVFVSVISIILQVRKITQKQRSALFWTVLITSVVFSLWCWLQCALDVMGLDRSNTLLCAGCTYQKFGFPHPNGLAIEPQFMGNLLIAPTLLALWCRFRHIPKQKWQRYLLSVIIFVLVATLFLTFSRGAIYAFVIALIILVVWAIKQGWFKLSLIFVPLLALGFTVASQGVMSELSPTHESFVTGVTKVYHQLSLGKIDLRPAEVAQPTPTTPANTPQPEFTGYVTESTDVRVNLTNYALKLWSSQPQILLFGVGLGGAGTTLHQNYPEQITSPKEIVQNQYASTLLETGVVGALLTLLTLVILIVYLWSSQRRPLIFSILVAYLATLFFFSGLPNALQIYLWLPLLV